MKDFEKFVKRLRYRYGKLEYMSIVEPQARGAWHVHVLLRFTEVHKIYIPNKDIAEMWGHGFVNVQGFRDDINNLGNYLCAYLTDGGRNSKKGVRLDNYESGIRLFNCSKGVKGRKSTVYLMKIT